MTSVIHAVKFRVLQSAILKRSTSVAKMTSVLKHSLVKLTRSIIHGVNFSCNHQYWNIVVRLHDWWDVHYCWTWFLLEACSLNPLHSAVQSTLQLFRPEISVIKEALYIVYLIHLHWSLSTRAGFLENASKVWALSQTLCKPHYWD